MTSDGTPHRTAIVTGAASGLGRAVAATLRDDGWHVAGLDLVVPSDVEVPITVDVSDPDAISTAVTEAVDRLGRLDAVAHCAGVFRNTLAPVHELDDATWGSTINVNLNGSFHVARATLPHLVANRGSIVLVASTAARHPQPGGAAYAASKAGVRALAVSIALEYAPLGVRCCSVSPGYMETGMTEKVLSREAIRADIEASLPLGRVADPAEVADVVTFLLGHGARFLVGQDVTVDGGGALTAYASPKDVERMWERRSRKADQHALR